MYSRFLGLAWFIFILVFLCGCGGGGGSPLGVPSGNIPTIKVQWPARSRQPIGSPASALSATLTLKGADANGADISITVDRDATQVAGYVGTYQFPKQVTLTNTSLTGIFYSQPQGQGSIVATATAKVQLNANNLDVSTISLVGTIKNVTVITSSLTVGGNAVQLGFTATDTNGVTVAVTPGSAQWSVVSGSGFLALTPDGLATPIAQGTASVAVTVDGIVSPSANVTVFAAPVQSPTVQITWPLRSRSVLPSNLTSAQSARIVVIKGDVNRQDVVVNVDRSPLPASYTATYTIPAAIRADVEQIDVQFYSLPGQQGSLVGLAFALVNINGTNLDIANFTLGGTIKKVSVAPVTISDQVLSQQLTFSAYDANNNLLVVTPGSGFWSKVGSAGPFTLTTDGILSHTPGSTGSGTVTVTVDGVTSAPATVTVTP